MPSPDDDIVEDYRLSEQEPRRITNLPPVDPAEEMPEGYHPPPASTTATDVQALTDRVNALTRLAEMQTQINHRILRIRTTTGVIALLGWITAIVALGQR